MHLVDVTMFWSGQGGGVRRYLSAKHDYLKKQPGVRHTIVVPGSLTAASPQVPGIPLPFSAGYRLPRNRSSVQRVLKELAPDLIEAGDPYQLAWAALRAGQDMSVPVAAFYHSNLPAMAQRALKEVGRVAAISYVKRLYKRFDMVFAPSRHIVEQLTEFGIERVTLQPLGVDTNLFRPDKRDPNWRAKHGIAPDVQQDARVGRYAAEKNLSVLVEAVAKLGSGYLLVMIGSGPLVPSGEHVMVLPFEGDMDELARAYASADVLVHAGDQETFGLAVLESLASGVPVIGCNQGGIAELVDSSVGYAVDGCHAAGFAEAISALFERDLSVLSLAARQRALSYDWNVMLANLERHYRRLLANNGSIGYGALEAA
jgi:alpha-1,6-mannosyltransferase